MTPEEFAAEHGVSLACATEYLAAMAAYQDAPDSPKAWRRADRALKAFSREVIGRPEVS